MAVQLLENWLLKEQEKIQTKYRHLNHISVVEPNILFCCRTKHSFYWGFHCRVLSSTGAIWNFKDDCQSRNSWLSDRTVTREP